MTYITKLCASGRECGRQRRKELKDNIKTVSHGKGTTKKSIQVTHQRIFYRIHVGDSCNGIHPDISTRNISRYEFSCFYIYVSCLSILWNTLYCIREQTVSENMVYSRREFEY